jgi:hypothetical protein
MLLQDLLSPNEVGLGGLEFQESGAGLNCGFSEHASRLYAMSDQTASIPAEVHITLQIPGDIIFLLWGEDSLTGLEKQTIARATAIHAASESS